MSETSAVRACLSGLSLSGSRDPHTCNAGDVAVMLASQRTPHRILTSIDGPCDNVIVVKQPMCFSKENADLLVELFWRLSQLLRRRTWRRHSHVHLRQTDRRRKRNEKFVYHRACRAGNS